MSVHDITTKIFKTKFGLGHYTVLLYDDKDYELYEMSRPMDRDGVNVLIDSGIKKLSKFISLLHGINHKNYFGKEVSMEEIMLPENLDIRTAIKNKQEQFYQLPF